MKRFLALFALLSLPAAATTVDPNCHLEALRRSEAILNPGTPSGSTGLMSWPHHWVRRAERHVARMQGSVIPKSENQLRLLTQAISKKVKQVNTSTGSELNWSVVEHQAGDPRFSLVEWDILSNYVRMARFIRAKSI
jgi:hypothetical protein